MAQHDLIRISLSLALVVILLFAGAWLVKRKGFGKNKTGPAIDVLSSRSLGGRNHIVVVQVDEVKLVVGVTPQQISLLHTFGEVGLGGRRVGSDNHDPIKAEADLSESYSQGEPAQPIRSENTTFQTSTTTSFEQALAAAQDTSAPSSDALPSSGQQSTTDPTHSHPIVGPPTRPR